MTTTAPDANASQASPLLSGSLLRAVTALAVPMLVSGALQEVQALIDLFWVGRLGAHAITAVAVSGVVLFMFAPVAVGLMVGTMAVVSRRVGAGQPREAGQAVAQSLLLAGISGLIVSVAGWFLAPGIFQKMGLHASAISSAADQKLIFEEGVAFLRILFAGQWMFFTLLASFASLQGAGNTRTPMVCSLCASALNIVLDPFLIYGLGPFPCLGVPGAALATVISQMVALAAALYALRKARTGFFVERAAFRPDFDLCKRILRVGLPGSGQIFLRSAMGLVMMRIVATCGPLAVAGYGVAWRWHMLILMPAFALGNATAALVGQNLGAKQPERARRAAWMASWLDAGLMFVFALAALAVAGPMVGLFTTDPEVRRIGAECLRVISPTYPAVAFGIVLGRALNGAGDSMAPMVITGISLWIVQVPAAFCFAQVTSPATMGIWYGMVAGNILHASLILARFRHGAWMRREV
jgi:putative MATE family efflux protein